MQAFKSRARTQILLHSRIGINPLTRLKPQSLQILTKRDGSKPSTIHPVIRKRQLLQHQTTLPNGLNPIETPFAPTKLQPYQPLAPLSQNCQPNIRNHRTVEPIHMPNKFQNLKIRAGGDPSQNVVAAALQFELLQSGTLLRDAQQPHLA